MGAGVQGRSHLEAMVEGLGVREVYVTSRTHARAEELAEYARQMGAKAQAVADPASVIDRCMLLVTATTSCARLVTTYASASGSPCRRCAR